MNARLFLSVAILFSACSSSKPKEDLPKELEQSSAKSTSSPEGVILNEAKKQYHTGLYSVAKDRFESLKDTYPTGPYTEFAYIKLADIEFDQGNYLAAAQQYEDFIKTYPTSTSAPYMIFRSARSYQLSNKGVGRDISPVEKSIELYDELLKKYPDTIYAKAGKQFRAEAVERIKDHEQFIVDFYEKRELSDAAASREETFKKHYAEVSKEPSVSTIKTASYLKPKVTESSTIISAERISNTDNQKDPDLKVKFKGNGDGINSVLTTACKSEGERQIYIYLSKPITDATFLKQFAKIKAVDGRVIFPLPEVQSKSLTEDCFSQADLIINTTGVVTVRNVRELELIPLENPPRLLLLPR